MGLFLRNENINLVNPAPTLDLSVCLSSPKNETHCLALIQRLGKAILFWTMILEREKGKVHIFEFRFLGLLENQENYTCLKLCSPSQSLFLRSQTLTRFSTIINHDGLLIIKIDLA